MLKRIIFIFISINLSTEIFSQQAKFYCDLTFEEESSPLQKQLREMIWSINGKDMRWNADTLAIEIDTIPDTLVFQSSARANKEIIICSINKAGYYKFVPNPCCGGFYLYNVQEGKFAEAKIQFKIKNGEKLLFAGKIDESGVIVKNGTAQMTPICRSAMASNICTVSLEEIKIYKDSSKNDAGFYCLLGNDPQNPAMDVPYKKLKQIFSFLYMPMSSEPISIVYDAKTKKWKME